MHHNISERLHDGYAQLMDEERNEHYARVSRPTEDEVIRRENMRVRNAFRLLPIDEESLLDLYHRSGT